MRKIIVSVINDLVTDQRVNKTCATLVEAGNEVLLVGRELKNSLPLEKKPYRMHRMKLFFSRGAFFYAEYNLRLFFFLLFKNADIYFSNDLDTLLANYLASGIRGKKLVYDTHEYYCYVPELIDRPHIQKVWLKIEQWIFPKLKWVFTVNESIAKAYNAHYGVEPVVVRNVPPKKAFENIEAKSKKDLGLPEDKRMVILQGAGININRGAEEAVMAMEWLEDTVLLILGGGDVIDKLKKMAEAPEVKGKIIFKPKMPFREMIAYTRCADVGLTLDKGDNPNYAFSLPNKLFDYIHAGVPVLASPLVEIKKVFAQFEVGMMIENHNPKHIAELLKIMIGDEQKQAIWRENAKFAARTFNWETESQRIPEVFKNI